MAAGAKGGRLEMGAPIPNLSKRVDGNPMVFREGRIHLQAFSFPWY